MLIICREQKKYGKTPLKKPVDLQRLNELVSIGYEQNIQLLIVFDSQDVFVPEIKLVCMVNGEAQSFNYFFQV